MRRKEKKTNKIYGIMALVFIGLMVLSGLGVYWSEDTSRQRYKDHKFDLTNQGWMLRLDGTNYYFDYLPSETFSLDISRDIFVALAQTPVFVMTSSYNDTYQEDIAMLEFKVLDILAQQQKYAGVGFNDYATGQIPQLTCANATPSTPIVQFQEGNTTNVYAEGSCLIVEMSSSYHVGLFRDRLIYEMLGIAVDSP